MSTANASKIVAGVADLFFASKISETARQVGVRVEFSGLPDAVFLEPAPPALIILDLNQRNLRPVELIGKLRADSTLAHVPIVAFANHENTELMARAKQAGCEEVLTRNAFSKGLPDLLRRFGGSERPV